MLGGSRDGMLQMVRLDSFGVLARVKGTCPLSGLHNACIASGPRFTLKQLAAAVVQGSRCLRAAVFMCDAVAAVPS